MIAFLYRCILLASPRDIRAESAAEMEDVLRHCVEVERARRGRWAYPVIWARSVGDALMFVVDARWSSRRTDSSHSVQGASSRKGSFMRKQDIKATIRFMRRQPFLAGIIVLMLGLGIGATTAIFSVVHGVLLQPLPFPEPDRLVSISGSRPDRGWDRVSLTEANFWDLHDMNHTFDELGAWHGGSAILTDRDQPEQVSASFVSSGFFRALGVRPVAGRLFTADDDLAGSTRPVLLSHALWTRRYGSDPGIVNRTIMFGSGPRLVVGVLPAGTPWLDSADLYVPFVRRADANRGSFEYTAIGRLKPGVTTEAALSDLSGIARVLAERYPAANEGLGVALDPSRDWMGGPELRRTLWVLLGAVGLLLVIACVNVTNLLLARASTQARERAVRAALGASRADLIRESLTESLILSTVAAVCGVLIAYGLLSVMQAINPGGIPRLTEVRINGWVLGFASLLALAVGVLTGLTPALSAPLAHIVPVLRQGQRGAMGDRRQMWLRSAFVATEVALSLMLLVGAGLLVRSLTRVLSVDRGFETENRLLLNVSVPASLGEARIAQTTKDVMAKVEALPDVLSAAAVSGRPLGRGSTGLGLAAADQPDSPGAPVPWGTWRIVTRNYFKTIGLPILAGRDFTSEEQIGKPWRAIISRRVADLLWPGQNAIGKTIILWRGQGDTRGEVVGVVGNMRERGLEAEPTLAVYFPPNAGPVSSLQLVLHTRGKPENAVASIRAAVASVDRSLPVSSVRTLEDMVSASVAMRRFTMLLLVAFAAVALLLALAGVSGVLAYAVARRTGEIGVRLALGARHNGLLRLVIAQGMRPVVLGLIVGLGGAFWLSRTMTSLLFGILPSDPATYTIVGAALAVTALAACYMPARQVLRVDPVTALRAE
jgi:putative ABC transport system permease protein